MDRLGKTVFIYLCVLALSAAPMFAQTNTGRVTGTVTDATGAVIPGVDITVRNPATGLIRNAVTNESGTYQVPLLPVGTYEVQAALAGFATEVRSGVTINVDAVVRQDFSLKVSSTAETIEVTAAAPLLQQETATLGQVIDSQKMTNIPLNARHFMSLTVLSTGVLPDVQGGDRQSPSFYANGVSRSKNNFLFDGVDNNDPGNNQLVIIPSIDAIEEFKLSTSAYGAELGRASGGVVNVQTKAGTNAFHFTLFEFLRNDALDARNYFAATKQPYRRNQFGAVVSGPIIRDKAFFLFNYEGNRIRRTDTARGRVPTALERQGNFSETATAIRDPLTGATFPGNIIPANRINTVARNIAAFYPDPNVPLNAGSNYTGNARAIRDFDIYTGRVDYRVSDGHSIFGRFTWQDTYEVQNNFDTGATLPRQGNTFFQPLGRNLAISDTYVISPTVVNEFRVGFNRLLGGIFDETYLHDHAKEIGVTGVQSSFFPNPLRFGWPRASVSTYSSIGTTGFSAQDRKDNTWHWYDMIALTKGNHQMKIGAEVRTYFLNIFIDSNPNGNFTFDGRYSGLAFADMLLGYASRTQRTVGNSYTQNRSRAFSAFFQDDWKVTPQFTLNLGVRYEMQTRSINVLKDNERNFAVFDPKTAQIVISGRTGPQTFRHPITGEAIVLQGGEDLGYPDGLYENDLNNFAPRFGFAWSPTFMRTVVRGGYGVFFEPEIAAKNHGNRDNAYPWNIPQTFIAPAFAVGQPPLNMNDPFPAALANSSLLSTANDPKQKDGYVQQWNLTLQTPLGNSMAIETAYVGTKGTKLTSSRPINSAVIGPGSIPSRRPFPAFAGINQNERANMSTYHSFQGKLERRFSSGLTAIASYTWSHSIECCSGIRDANNLFWEKSNSSFDVRHRQVNSFSYDLPFGTNATGALEKIIGGWQVAGILTFQTGNPFTPSVPGDVANVGDNSSRPDRISDGTLPRGERSASKWFDTTAFVRPANGTYGNSGQNIVYGPGVNNLDLTFTKITRLGENHRVEFRTELYNALNHGQFLRPNTTVTSPQFGSISAARDGRQIQFGLKFVY
jgi:hypothetical protein